MAQLLFELVYVKYVDYCTTSCLKLYIICLILSATQTNSLYWQLGIASHKLHIAPLYA